MSGLFEFMEQNSIYIVLAITLIIWGGIFLFLSNTDKRLKEIEKELMEQKNEK